ncbi:TM0106 family RecB-like putative nuclease [Candidatus Pelagibacter ubique]|nr:TM0106 family RecB-like putative nuclease [Candidatus Pelagibacter ubique]
MKIKKGKFFISPSDLNNFVACKYTALNEIKFHNKEIKKNEDKANDKLWKEMGIEHEKKHFKILKDKYKKSISIKSDLDENDRFNETVRAIQKGYDLIYHAYLIDENFRGEADFLIKCNTPSELGNYSYEVYDTKITRNLKPRHVTQITAYSDMLGKIQKLMPEKMYLIDGSDELHSFKTIEYIELFNHGKKEFVKFLSNTNKEKLYPEKCSYCNLCNWKDECDQIWEKDNYVNLVAGSNKFQIEKLKRNKVRTVEQLAKTKLIAIDLKINTESFEKIKSQAQLQEEKRLTGEDKIIFLDPDIDKGFYKLPKPDDGDIFFDIEGFPRMDRPFEYLHGLYYKDKGKLKFKDLWAKNYDKESEKNIFIELIDFFEKRFEEYPNAHIYHYAPYEKRAIRELATVYSSEFPKGDIINDELLRKEKYVDLFAIAKQSIRTSERDMSLKSIEKFYDFERKADIVKADDSVAKYDNWIATKNEKHKQDIINYNKEDCVSTYHLREFLVKNKPESIDWFVKPEEIKKEPSKYRKKSEDKITREDIEIDLIERLTNKKNKKNHLFVENLQNLVGFHWRDKKPDLWDVFDDAAKSHLELEDNNDCIANCVLQTEKPETTEYGYIFKYKFPDQNYKLKRGSKAFDVHEKKELGSILSIEEKLENNLIEIFCPKKKDRQRKLHPIPELPSLLTIGKGYPPKTPQHELALNKFIDDYIQNDGKNYKSIMDMLERNNPDIKGLKKNTILIDPNKDLNAQSIKIVKDLNNSYLTIQGPPGTGKTYTSASMIIALIKDGKRVGVTSNSHEAIKTLLIEIEKQASLPENKEFTFKGFRKAKSGEKKTEWQYITDADKKPEDLNDYSLYAGTSWFFVNPQMHQSLDYLFIDEAGQVALGTTIANATSAKNLVLIGDQMQLSQPIRAKHNGYARKSSLDFVLENLDTIPPEKGIFLNTTRRLNKKICKFISDSFYESRLTPHEEATSRSVKLKLDPIKDEGIFYVPIDHIGCSQRSDEEADLIEKTYNKIIDKEFKVEDKEGQISPKDIMVVAPYNAQANNIRERLNKKYKDDVRVGTIDLFQGQEAKIVLISMTTSDVESLPRHKDFFFSRNRLNVAISRAQCVAIIIFNEKLLLASTNSIEEMKLMNNFCKLLKFKTNYK